MKKRIVAILLLLTLFLCSCTKDPLNDQGTPKNNEVGEAEAIQPKPREDEVVKEQEDSKDSKENEETEKKDESKVEFIAVDNYYIDDDRSIRYYYNYKGELIGNSQNYHIYAENGLASSVSPATGYVGYIDKEGMFVIEPKYSVATKFSKSGLAAVAMWDKENSKYLWGFVNAKGEEIIPCKYDDVYGYYDSGYAELIDGETHIIVDENGKTMFTLDNVSHKAFYDDYIVWEMKGTSEETVHKITDYFGNDLLSEIHERVLSSRDLEESMWYINIEIAKMSEEDINNFIDQNVLYVTKSDNLYRVKFGIADKSVVYQEYEVFTKDGFKVAALPLKDYTIESKLTATTVSGYAYGIVKNGDTVVPFEYDKILERRGYFICEKYTENYTDNSNLRFTFDIYNSAFECTGSVEYEYTDYSRYNNDYYEDVLENEYFFICQHENYDTLTGIADYQGNIIVPPIYYRDVVPNNGHTLGKLK